MRVDHLQSRSNVSALVGASASAVFGPFVLPQTVRIWSRWVGVLFVGPIGQQIIPIRLNHLWVDFIALLGWTTLWPAVALLGLRVVWPQTVNGQMSSHEISWLFAAGEAWLGAAEFGRPRLFEYVEIELAGSAPRLAIAFVFSSCIEVSYS